MGGIDDHHNARKNSYGAMGMFFITFLISVAFLIRDELKPQSTEEGDRRRRSGHEYEGIPQDTGPIQGYSLNLDLPLSVQTGVYS